MVENPNPCPDDALHVGQLIVRKEFGNSFGVLYCPIHDKDYPVPGQTVIYNRAGKIAMSPNPTLEQKYQDENWTTNEVQKYKRGIIRYGKEAVGDITQISKVNLLDNITVLDDGNA